MLNFMMVLLLKMVDYFLSYAEMKFDDEFYSCSIHELCCVLVKINVGFMLVEAC